MKNIILAAFAVLMTTTAFSQVSIPVTERDMKIDKISRTGLSIRLDLDKKFVKDLWKKKLKEYGKVSGSLSMDAATIPSISSRSVRVLSSVTSDGKGCIVWFAVDLGDKWVTKNGGTGYSAAEKILKDFGLSCYREEINEEIKDAEKALAKVVKEEENVIKKGEQLQHDIEKNGKEKERLDQEIIDNAEEKKQLESDIEQNKKDKEKAKEDVSEAQKAVEIVKAKLQKVY